MSDFSFDRNTAIQLHKQGKASQLHGFINSKLVKAAVYGANDGIITTFAVVAGVAGAGLSPAIVLILGVANLIADGISMGIGDYLGEKSEQKFIKYQYDIEKWEVENIPEEEAKELQEFFHHRGVSTPESKKLVEIIRKHPKLWTELGFIDEMGMTPDEDLHLWKGGAVTFLAFVAAGVLPLVPYILLAFGLPIPQEQQFIVSIITTGITLFAVGSARTLVTKGKWWLNGLEMLGIGAIAAVSAYLAGAVLEKLV